MTGWLFLHSRTVLLLKHWDFLSLMTHVRNKKLLTGRHSEEEGKRNPTSIRQLNHDAKTIVIVVTICSSLWEQNIINMHWFLSLSCTCIFDIVFHYHFFILYLGFYFSICICHFLFHLSTYLLKGGFPTLFPMVQDGSYQIPTNILKLLPGLDRIRTAFRVNVVPNTK